MSKKKKIFVIDDEQESCEFISHYLQRHGFETDFALNGEEGLEKIRFIRPDLVLCDIFLPGLNGMEILKMIKEYNPDISVIMLTGYGSMETVLECLKLGAYDYLAKPIDLEKLLMVIKEALVKKEQIVSQKKILIVDDERQLLESISVRLKASGYAVFTAENGIEGIDKFKEIFPDLVILDIMMPGLSGLDTLKEIKELRKEIPVIILTAYGTPQSAIEALKLGAYDYLAKPFNTQTLLEMIKKAIP